MRIVFNRFKRQYTSFPSAFVVSQSTIFQFQRSSVLTRFYTDSHHTKTRQTKMSDQAPKEEANLHKDPYVLMKFLD
jgi:hypothetical protein